MKVGEVLRHTDIRQTRAYTLVAEKLTRGAADRMGDYLTGSAAVADLDQERRQRRGH